MIENNGQMSSNKYKLGQIEASILDSFPDPIVIVDQNRNVLAANFPARELIGKERLMFILEDYAKLWVMKRIMV
tara:strand:- start:12 stop:233 length:222 start_codon:yes stop_codon:yes gene_type:complete